MMFFCSYDGWGGWGVVSFELGARNWVRHQIFPSGGVCSIFLVWGGGRKEKDIRLDHITRIVTSIKYIKRISC